MGTVPRAVRTTLSIAIITLATFLCLGFWFTRSEWNPTVLGRYSVSWFACALMANTVIIFVSWLLLHAMWWRAPQGAEDQGALSPGKRLAFMVVAMVPLLAVVEIALHVAGMAPVAPNPMSMAGTGRNYHSLLQHVDRVERDGALVRAYRGRVYDRAKGTALRVVCLGGSTTWGHRLPAEAAWPALVEASLRRDGYDVEVINAGRPWYTTAHSITNYALQMRHFDSDVVVIMHGMNDLERSFPLPGEPTGEWDYGGYQGPMRDVLEVYRETQQGSHWRPGEWLESLALYRLVRDKTAIDRKFYETLRTPAAGRLPISANVDRSAFTTLAPYRANLEYLVDLCRRDGRAVVLSTQAHAYARKDLSALDGVVEVTRKEFLRVSDGRPISRESVRLGMQAVREIILDVARQGSVTLADPERAIGDRLDLFMDDLHLNAAGTALAADIITEALRPLLDRLQSSQSVATSAG